jgi:hypothetical protein
MGREMKHIIHFITASVLLGGCTSDPGFTGVSGIREVSASEVSQCTYLTDIRAKPGVYGILAEQGIKYSRNTILASARDAGGNTVVFDPVEPGAVIDELHAVAYRC